MSAEYRLLTLDDYEQAAFLEARAFYNMPNEHRTEQMRKFFPPDWTVGAFVDSKLVADVRTIPQARRMGNSTTAFGAVGPVACLAPYRRQGHVRKLLKMALELMRQRGQALSGLHTPHDALYRRYGWERAEGKKRYRFPPKRAQLRFQGSRGSVTPVGNDDWARLDKIYRAAIERRNGPFTRVEVWWREAVLRDHDTAGPVDRDAVVWTNERGADRGYALYQDRAAGRYVHWDRHELVVWDLVALDGDAYLGLWEHILTHDLADAIVWDTRPDDCLPDLFEDPSVVEKTAAEGAMLRIVDIERAFTTRPYFGAQPASAVLRVEDRTLPENDGTWRIEGSGGEMRAERTDTEPDAELSVNLLAPLYTGHIRPSVAAGCGMIRVRDDRALETLDRLFAVDDIPFCPDWY